MKRLPVYLLLSTLLVGCTLPPLSISGPGGNNVASANQPVEALNGLNFSPLTADNAKYMSASGVIAAGSGNFAGSTGASVGAAAPMAATTARAAAPTTAGGADVAVGAPTQPVPETAPSAAPGGQGGAVSGNVYSYYGYGTYFNNGDPLQAMSLVSVTQAKTKGSSGSFTEILKSIVAPVVKAWAKDARLVSSNATLNTDGSPVVNPNNNQAMMQPFGYYDGNGWQYIYASDSRSEVLNFTVTPSGTTIIRMRWAPLNLSPDLVTVDATSAIQKLKAAVSDKTFKSVEEQSGNDYFLGFPFTQPQAGACCGDRVDVLYQIPDNVQWNVSLQSILGKLVWQMNWHPGYGGMVGPIMAGGGVAIAEPAIAVAAPAAAPDVASPTPSPKANASDTPSPLPTPVDPVPSPSLTPVDPVPTPQGYWENDYGQGMVDAETGAVIRFTRPTRTYYGMATGVGTVAPEAGLISGKATLAQ